MRLSLILGLCIVLCGAVVAQANLIPIIDVSGDITDTMFACQRTSGTYAGGTVLEKLEIYIVGDLPSDKKLQLFEGTMLASDGGYIVAKYPGTLADYANNMAYVLPKGETQKIWDTNIADAPQSWVNLAGGNAASGYSTVEYPGLDNYWYSDNAYDSYTSIFGGWFTKYNGSYSTALDTDVSPIGTWMPDAKLSKVFNTDEDLPAGFDTTLFATLYVKPGTDVTFTGNPTWGGWGFTDSVNVGGSFTTTIPEPSILALAGMGLVGLLCYAWRKRR